MIQPPDMNTFFSMKMPITFRLFIFCNSWVYGRFPTLGPAVCFSMFSQFRLMKQGFKFKFFSYVFQLLCVYIMEEYAKCNFVNLHMKVEKCFYLSCVFWNKKCSFHQILCIYVYDQITHLYRKMILQLTTQSRLQS